MNFSQMHERLRLEMLRRIQRGTLSVSLLARQTGFGQSHVSSFLHRKRQLSLAGLDRVLAAQHLLAGDLLPSRERIREEEDLLNVPLVAHATAMFEPVVRPGAVQRLVQVDGETLMRMGRRAPASRHAWLRFVMVQVSATDAAAMDPVLTPDALVLVDRHYNSLMRYRPVRPNLYAVRHEGTLKIRYANFLSGWLVLRPFNRAMPVELIKPGPGESPEDLITGRVARVMSDL